eukprot:6054697-Pleurochrysis_carterae.AAC.2
MTRHNMPTAYAISGRVWRGRSSPAGAWFLWKAVGTPSGSTQSASVVMSTLSRSDTGPSSSTFHRADKAVVKEA